MLLQAASHNQYWTDLLDDLEGISWPRIISILMHKSHGFSNYEKCKKRDHTQVRQDVFDDEKVKIFVSNSPENAKKMEKVLDEMCHLLAIQTAPTRKLKWTGAFFMKCITRIYSSIYVNAHLLPLPQKVTGSRIELFREQFLKLSNRMPVVILPTHRSYMDFLFITYVMFINELPLPIVAAGDNFKALGGLLTNYLKATGAFLIRRKANDKKHNIEANNYYDILRAYVHSIVGGGENPIEFFMEGTRTRLGQVLRPKTGLLSMIVDMYLEGLIDDICILPVAINYQRPIEEQLYVSEMTPQISKSKPKETAKNLLAAFDKIMKRKYGKVYVRFLEPFRLSDYHHKWTQATSMSTTSVDSVDMSVELHNFTNSLASKVCLAQANSNVLMPFNLVTYSILARSFLANQNNMENSATKNSEPMTIRVPIEDVTRDFLVLEDLLKGARSDFVPGWKGHLDILDEFKINRDGIIRASSDRRTIQFEYNARTFHTFAYYSNQVMQILLPIAISSLLSNDKISDTKLDHYKSIRSLLSREFLVDDISLEKEFVDSFECIEKRLLCKSAMEILHKHLLYFMNSYMIFLKYLKGVDVMVESEFFQQTHSENENHFISKDMLNNMKCLVKDLKICSSIAEDDPKLRLSTSTRREEQLEVQSKEKLTELIEQFQNVKYLIYQSSE